MHQLSPPPAATISQELLACLKANPGLQVQLASTAFDHTVRCHRRGLEHMVRGGYLSSCMFSLLRRLAAGECWLHAVPEQSAAGANLAKLLMITCRRLMHKLQTACAVCLAAACMF